MRSSVHIFSVAEYLDTECKSEVRHEYLGGQICAMSGGSKAHNIITLNIASRLRSQLRSGACDVFTAVFDQIRHNKGRRAKPRNGFYILLSGGFESKLL